MQKNIKEHSSESVEISASFSSLPEDEEDLDTSMHIASTLDTNFTSIHAGNLKTLDEQAYQSNADFDSTLDERALQALPCSENLETHSSSTMKKSIGFLDFKCRLVKER